MLPNIAVLTLVLVASQAASRDECLTRRAVSVSKRVIAADVVISGTIKKLLYTIDDNLEEYAADVIVHWVYKGQDAFPDDFDPPKTVFVSGFGQEEACRNEVELGDTKVFFLKVGDDGRLALNYYWIDSRFADGIGTMQSKNLDQTIRTVAEIKNDCQASRCCPNGVTKMREDGGCTDLKVNITDPVVDNRVEIVSQEPVDLIDKLGFRNLPTGINIANVSSCPDVSQLSFRVGPEAVLNENVSTVFENWDEFPQEFLVFVRSKQDIDEQSYLMALIQNGRHVFALRFQETTVELEFIHVNNASQSVAFDADVTDNKYHRLMLEVLTDSVSLYDNCKRTGIQQHFIQRKKVPFEGQVIIGQGEPANSHYHGVLEILKISSEVGDAEKLCETYLPNCPDPSPPTSGLTTPPPTSRPTTPPSTSGPTTPQPASSPTTPPSTSDPPTTRQVTLSSGLTYDTASLPVSYSDTASLPVSYSDKTTSSSHPICEDPLPCFYGTCSSMNGQCVCPMCPHLEVVDRVCGSDMVTYGSLCSMEMTSCADKKLITYMYGGPCEIDEGTEYPTDPTDHDDSGSAEQCDEQTCQFGGRCEERDGSFGCVCDTECTTEYLPVCGSDSVTYSNNCSMMGASCRKQQEIRRVMDGECASTYPCLGEADPVKDDEGHFYTCDVDDSCPAESSCDISARVCCPLTSRTPSPTPSPTPTVLIDCNDSTFGCCKDGVTVKGGEDDEGCPGEVDFTLELSKSRDVTEAEAFCPSQRTNATAYSVTPAFLAIVETMNIYPVQFPKYFSILVTARLSESVNGSLLVKYGESGSVEISVSVRGGIMVLEYAGSEERFNFLDDGEYHRFALSFHKGYLMVYKDCVEIGMRREQHIPFDSMGYISINGRLGCIACGVEGDIDQLSIIPDPDAARAQCGGLLYCPTTSPPVTTRPTTAEITTKPITTTAAATTTTTPTTMTTTTPVTTSPNLSGPGDSTSFDGQDSYLKLQQLPRSRGFTLKMDFIATGNEGVMFYGDYPESGTFIALSYESRSVYLRMNDGGSNVSLVHGGKKLKRDEQFTVEVSVKKSSVSLGVTGRKGVSQDRATGNNRFEFENVYVGGIPVEFEPMASAGVIRGFQGCIRSLQINDIPIDFMSASSSSGVTKCDIATKTPEMPATTATPSQDTTTATPAATTLATTEPTPSTAKSASFTTMPTSLPPNPSFSGAGSFLAFKSPEKDSRNFQLEIEFMVSGNDGLMFYVGNAASGDYVSVSYDSSRVRVKINSGSEPTEITSAGRKLSPDSRLTLNLNVKKADISLDVSSRSKNKTSRTGSDKFEFGDENMYVGGLPASFTLVPGSQQTSGLSAFEGCVFSASVNSEELDLTAPDMSGTVTACRFIA